MITEDRQYRSYQVEKSDKEDMRVRGTAIVFDTPTMLYERDGIKYYEVIHRNALDDTIMDDVVMNINHVGRPIAKTKNETLILKKQPNGLDFEADLSRIERSREVYREVEEGYLDEMSFAFTISDEAYDKESRTRTVKKIDRLWDVAAVDNAAYPNTVLELDKVKRSFFEAEAERELADARELEVSRRTLALKLKLGGNL